MRCNNTSLTLAAAIIKLMLYYQNKQNTQLRPITPAFLDYFIKLAIILIPASTLGNAKLAIFTIIMVLAWYAMDYNSTCNMKYAE